MLTDFQKQLLRLKREAAAEMLKKREEYRVNESESDPDYVIRALDRIMEATNASEADQLKAAAVEKMRFHCSALTITGRAKGPVSDETPMSLESQAKTAERFAVLAVKAGNAKTAEKQQKAAEDLRKKALKLRKGMMK